MTPTVRTAAVITGSVLTIDVALTTASVVCLAASGPSPFGYVLLALANRTAWLVALLGSVTALLMAAEGRRRITSWLAAATAVTLAVAVGLRVVGLALAQSIAGPGPRIPDLYSLFLAMAGTGADLAPLPITFGIAGLIAFATTRTRGGIRVG